MEDIPTIDPTLRSRWKTRMKTLVGAAFDAALIDSYGMHVLMEAINREAYTSDVTACRVIQEIKREEPRQQ
jgi:hypothetical protein